MKRHLMPALALSLLLAGCGSGQFSNPFTTTLTVTATPQVITASSSAPGRTSLTAIDSSTGTTVTGLNVTATDVPDGVTVTPTGSTVTVTPAPATPAGSYPVTLHASVPGGSGDVLLSVTVSAPVTPSYTVAVSSVTTPQGSGVHVAATITPDAGYTGSVKVVRVDGGAPNITVVPDASGATLTPAMTTAPGVYAYTLVTRDQTGEKATPFTLTVTTTK